MGSPKSLFPQYYPTLQIELPVVTVSLGPCPPDELSRCEKVHTGAKVGRVYPRIMIVTCTYCEHAREILGRLAAGICKGL